MQGLVAFSPLYHSFKRRPFKLEVQQVDAFDSQIDVQISTDLRQIIALSGLHCYSCRVGDLLGGGLVFSPQQLCSFFSCPLLG